MANSRHEGAKTLQELLDIEHIELHEPPRINGKQMGGPRTKIRCPECQGGRERELNFYVLFDADANGFKWFCQRASCGHHGGARIPGTGAANQAAWTPKVYRRPLPPEEVSRPDKFLEYFSDFGISRATVEAFGVYRTERRMPAFGKDGKQLAGTWLYRPVIAYPYREDGSLLNVKYKTVYPQIPAKRFVQEPDAEPSLYNIDAFTSDELGIVVEGEEDCMAIWEAGFRQVTTLADGSPSKLSETYDPLTDDDDRYLPIRGNVNPRIRALKKVILAGDMDAAGRRHHEEIARRLGRGRCWVVTWPQDCKDAKDTLQKRGRDAVRFAIEVAEPYPLEGVEVLTDQVIDQLWLGIAQRRYITGQPAIDERLSLRDEGGFFVTTGIPGHGKTAAWNALSVLYTDHNEKLAIANAALRPFHTVVFGAEMSTARLAADLISQHSGKPFFPNKHIERISREEVLELNARWLRKHFSFIRWQDRSTQPTVSWVLDKVDALVTRTGAKLVILDPWQEMDDEMPANWRRTPSEWIGRVLQRMIGLAVDRKTNIVLIVHPMKPKERNKDGSYPIPVGYDIGGSQNFYSRCDAGFTVHRPRFESSEMLLRCWKTKERQYATTGDTMLRFDPNTTRIYPMPVVVDALAGSAGVASQNWQEQSEWRDEENF